MAHQHYRQACLARWPGHHSMNTETRGKRSNSQVSSQRSEAEGHGGDASAQPRLWQGGHHPEATAARGAASCSRPSGREQQLEATSGLQAAIQPMRRRRATASTEKRGRKLQQGQPEQIKPQGRDPLGGAWRRWRRLEAKTTKPHGQEEACDKAEQIRHRAVADLAGAHWSRARSLSMIQNRQRGLGLETDREGEASEGAASWAKPVQSSPSGWTDRWAQAVSQPF
jgi:hypothetical protein